MPNSNVGSREPHRNKKSATKASNRNSLLDYNKLEGKRLLATLTVNSLADNTTSGDGLVTLREALLAANSDTMTDLNQTGSGADTISFSLPGSAPYNILPTSGLPTITEAITIDGTTQAGYVDKPIIMLNGQNAGNVSGLRITGGSSTVRALSIGNFGQYGILLQTGGGNKVEGSYLGVDTTGVNAAPNTRDGVLMFESPNNTIGGPLASQRNVISGNSRHGVGISNAPSAGNIVENNLIGVSSTGDTGVGNGSYGIRVTSEAHNNQIQSNVISGNVNSEGTGYGIVIQLSSNNNLIDNNQIGVDETGVVAIPNDRGVWIGAGSSSNTVSNNTISGNQLVGLEISGSGSTGNQVVENRIGVNQDATAAIPNDTTGLRIDEGATDNSVSNNTISGNQNWGVIISDSGSSNNQIFGNQIGVNRDGIAAIPNGNGLLVDQSASNNFVTDNIVSGNTGTGLLVWGTGTSANQFSSNIVGLAANSIDVIPNANGIWVGNGASNNVIGLPSNGGGNIVSGNTRSGIGISDGNTDGNTVQNNLVGVDTNLAPKPNEFYGLLIDEGASNNLIGGANSDEGNILSGNSFDGILIAGMNTPNNTTGNLIKGNSIGVDHSGNPIPNGRHGIFLREFTSDNIIGGTETGAGNTIAYNTRGGVKMDRLDYEGHALPGTGNSVLGNDIYLNIVQGIDINMHGPEENDTLDTDAGANGTQNHPVITSVTYDDTNIHVTGNLSSKANNVYRIELFLNDRIASVGDGQSYVFATTTNTNAAGLGTFSASFVATAFYGGSVTATATDADGNTSEFSSPGLIESAAGLPLISIHDRATLEGSSGTSTLSFEVRLSEPASSAINIPFTVSGISATFNQDFQTSSGTVPFAVGDQSKNIDITVVADGIDEGDETISVSLGSVSGGIVIDNSATGTIFDDDSNNVRPLGADWYDLDSFMLGKIYVPVFVLDSDGTIDEEVERWAPNQENEIKQIVIDGLAWWNQALANITDKHTLEFVPDFTFVENPVSIPYEPYTRNIFDNTTELVTGSFLDFVSHDTADPWYNDLRNFMDTRRIEKGADWAFPIFFNMEANDYDSDYADMMGFNNFAGAELYEFNGSTANWETIVHETAHVFYALDEYGGENGALYTERSGYYNTQNLNATNGHPNPSDRVPSVMDGLAAGAAMARIAYDTYTSSPSSLAMMGWQDSDGDGIFDVLDLPLLLDGNGTYDSGTETFSFVGSASAQALGNLNERYDPPFVNDITITRVNELQYRIDGGAWITVANYDAHQVSIDVEISLPAGSQVELRAVADIPEIESAYYSFAPQAIVAGSSFYYAGSAYASGGTSGAVDSNKLPLLPGGTATYANISNYTKGINGVIVDVSGLAGTPTASEFQFRTGNSDTPASWPILSNNPTISVEQDMGAGGSDRIVLTWPDNTIQNQWLQITVLANSTTNLATDQVFYLGNAIGETGNSTSNAIVNLIDVGLARVNQSGLTPASIDNNYDFNRDARVNLIDVAIARVNQSGFNALRLISVPASSFARSDGDSVLADDKTEIGSTPFFTSASQMDSKDKSASTPVALRKDFDPSQLSKLFLRSTNRHLDVAKTFELEERKPTALQQEFDPAKIDEFWADYGIAPQPMWLKEGFTQL